MFGCSVTYCKGNEMKAKFTKSVLATGLMTATGVFFVGCATEPTPTASESSESTDWQAGLDEEVVVALSELSESDRQAALEQKTCPVTDKQLGSMGKPPKVSVEGTDVFLCCDGCEAEIKGNPEQYLAELSRDQ